MAIESEPKDISNEAWREYEWQGTERGVPFVRVYRITNPKSIVFGTTTHRVIDANNVVHCVPSVGLLGCVLRWTGKDGTPAMTF